jgi:hypothetical protein
VSNERSALVPQLVPNVCVAIGCLHQSGSDDVLVVPLRPPFSSVALVWLGAHRHKRRCELVVEKADIPGWRCSSSHSAFDLVKLLIGQFVHKYRVSDLRSTRRGLSEP